MLALVRSHRVHISFGVSYIKEITYLKIPWRFKFGSSSIGNSLLRPAAMDMVVMHIDGLLRIVSQAVRFFIAC